MVTHSSIYFGFSINSPLHHAFEKAAVKGRIMSQYSDIKYIVGEDWTCNLMGPRCHAQPFDMSCHVLQYNVLDLEILTSHIPLRSSKTRGF